MLGPLEPDGARTFTYDYDQDRCSQYDATIRLTGVVAPDGTIRALRLVHRGEAVVWRSPL